MTVRSATVGGHRYAFADLRTLLAKATPARSGDLLAGVAAGSAAERVATALGQPVVVVDSAAGDRVTYLQRPDLGRRLAPSSRALLQRGDHDLAVVLADGLSARAPSWCCWASAPA